jgi:hypothetical protein
VFVGRAWAETFDANSRRLLEGTDFALLEQTNRVLERHGFLPEDRSTPMSLARHATLRLRPHHDAWLHLTLRPRDPVRWKSGAQLLIESQAETETQPASRFQFTEAAPWKIALPLKAGVITTVTLEIVGEAAGSCGESNGEGPVQITSLRIAAEP